MLGDRDTKGDMDWKRRRLKIENIFYVPVFAYPVTQSGEMRDPEENQSSNVFRSQ